MKYRKKPVVVEAEVYRKGLEDGFAPDDECYAEFGRDLDSCSRQESQGCKGCRCFRPYIKTLEGKHFITEGDYIITGIKGERYPCKPDIFEATYEAVEECADRVKYDPDEEYYGHLKSKFGIAEGEQ